MRRTRARSRRAQDGCPLFIEQMITSVIISKLAKLDRASLALTCSLARTAVHSEVTALDFSRSTSTRNSSSGRGSGSGRRPRTDKQTTQVLQRCLQDACWARLEALVLPTGFHYGICSAAALVKQRWPRLRSLTVVGNDLPLLNKVLSDAGLLVQLRTQLTRLHLTSTRIDAVAAQRLAEARLDGLQELCLDNNLLGDQGFQQLVAGRWPNLTALTVRANFLTGAAGQYLAAAAHLTALASLGLQKNDITGALVQALVSATHLQLMRLDLSDNTKFGSRGLVELLRVTQLIGGLCGLTLSNVGLGPGTIPALVAATHLSCLADLNLWGNDRLGDNDFATLPAATHLSTLQQLTLGYHSCYQPHAFHAQALALRRMLLPNLTSLALRNTYLTIAGTGCLASAALPSLHTLRLFYTDICRKSLLALATADWPALEVLDLQCNHELGAAVLMELWRMRQKCPGLRSLVVTQGVDAGSVQARLAKGAWAELTVVHAERP